MLPRRRRGNTSFHSGKHTHSHRHTRTHSYTHTVTDIHAPTHTLIHTHSQEVYPNRKCRPNLTCWPQRADFGVTLARAATELLPVSGGSSFLSVVPLQRPLGRGRGRRLEGLTGEHALGELLLGLLEAGARPAVQPVDLQTAQGSGVAQTDRQTDRGRRGAGRKVSPS